MFVKKESKAAARLLIVILVAVVVLVFGVVFDEVSSKEANDIATNSEVEQVVLTTDICTTESELEPEPEPTMLTEEEIDLIALVVMAEAEGECELGKRLVIDTILNRVDSEYWPDTVSEVIWQPNQFTSMWNGRADRCYVRDDICHLVMEELTSRTNYDVVYFTADKYGRYGRPLLQVENHYFSSYE